MKLSVVGLGKLGAPLAAVLASRGHTVVGVDANPEAVERINRGEAPVRETGLQELLDTCRARVSATTDTEAAAAATDATFVIVPTPSGVDGAFSHDFVLDAVARIGRGITRKAQRHVVVVTSTVMPGATGGPIAAALESASGLEVGDGVGLCYSPEFIALGSVIRDMTHPDFCLIGESDAASGDVLAAILLSIVGDSVPMMRMNLVNAELAKIAVNTFVTTKISFANMLAEICERLPDGDAQVVTDAIGLDGRIGQRYLQGATGYGGPCFPRDNRAFAVAAASVGAQADIAAATDSINRRQVDRIVERSLRHVNGRGRVAVLGLSYKPQTQVVEASTGVALASALSEKGVRVTVYDPAAMEEAERVLGTRVAYAESAARCVREADVTVIATAWPEFSQLDAVDFTVGGRPVVIDCWRVLEPGLGGDRLEIIQLGRSGAELAARTPERTSL
jgi:UDPglucose 6-dehydrogenase